MQLVLPVDYGKLTVPVLMVIGMMHPSCCVRVNWDSLVLSLLASVCLITPYIICFDVTAVSTAIGTYSTSLCVKK